VQRAWLGAREDEERLVSVDEGLVEGMDQNPPEMLVPTAHLIKSSGRWGVVNGSR